MDNSRRAREDAEALVPGSAASRRSEKGTANLIIAAETNARQEKTERLKAARLAQAETMKAEAIAEAKQAKKRAGKSADGSPPKKTASRARKKPAAV